MSVQVSNYIIDPSSDASSEYSRDGLKNLYSEIKSSMTAAGKDNALLFYIDSEKDASKADVMFLYVAKDLQMNADSIDIKFPTEINFNTSSERFDPSNSLLAGYDSFGKEIYAFRKIHDLVYVTHSGVKIAEKTDFFDDFDTSKWPKIESDGDVLRVNTKQLTEKIDANIISNIDKLHPINVDKVGLNGSDIYREMFVRKDYAGNDDFALRYFSKNGSIITDISLDSFDLDASAIEDFTITPEGYVNKRGTESTVNRFGDLSDLKNYFELDIGAGGDHISLFCVPESNNKLSFYTKAGVKAVEIDISKENEILGIKNIEIDVSDNVFKKIVTTDTHPSVKYSDYNNDENLLIDDKDNTVKDINNNNIYATFNYDDYIAVTHTGVFVDSQDIAIPKLSDDVIKKIINENGHTITINNNNKNSFDGFVDDKPIFNIPATKIEPIIETIPAIKIEDSSIKNDRFLENPDNYAVNTDCLSIKNPDQYGTIIRKFTDIHNDVYYKRYVSADRDDGGELVLIEYYGDDGRFFGRDMPINIHNDMHDFDGKKCSDFYGHPDYTAF